MVCVSSYSHASHTRRWQTAGAARVGPGHGEGSRSSWRQTLGRQLCNSAWLNSVPDSQWNLTRSLLNMHHMDWSVCKYTHTYPSHVQQNSHMYQTSMCLSWEGGATVSLQTKQVTPTTWCTELQSNGKQSVLCLFMSAAHTLCLLVSLFVLSCAQEMCQCIIVGKILGPSNWRLLSFFK